MELPKGIQLSSGNSKNHVLRLIKNVYGQKQAGRVWNQHLAKGLQKAGFVAFRVDECEFYKGKTIFIVYVYDGIFFGPVEERSRNKQKTPKTARKSKKLRTPKARSKPYRIP
jgi:hypothetical protein